MRVLHAPNNIGNQMMALAQGVRAYDVEVVTCEFESKWLQYPVDRCLYLERSPTHLHRRVRQLKFFLWAARRFDVFHFHYGCSLLPRHRDLVLLSRLGRRVFMHYWGSDARPENPDPTLDWRRVRRLKRVGRRAHAALVADAELHSHVAPYFDTVARLPQAVDLGALEPSPVRDSVAMPLVVHAPSQRRYKGTMDVQAAVERLRGRHRFTYVLVENTPHRAALEIYRKADIIIDQIELGTHGVLSIEGMALAKPVVCYIDPRWRSGYPPELPLISATTDTLDDELAALLSDGRRRRELGEAGRAYVEHYHDAQHVGAKLYRLYTDVSVKPASPGNWPGN